MKLLQTAINIVQTLLLIVVFLYMSHENSELQRQIGVMATKLYEMDYDVKYIRGYTGTPSR